MSDTAKKAILWAVIIALGIVIGWSIGTAFAAADAFAPTPTPTPQPTPHVEVVEYDDAVCYVERPSDRIVDCYPRETTPT